MINYSLKINERLIGATITNEAHTIGITAVATATPGLIRLIEVPQAPSPLSTVSIPGYNEIFSGSPVGTQFLVDYVTGVIAFNVSQDGNAILVSYIGLGSEIGAEDINELQGPVGIALNYNGSLSNNIVKPASISNTVSDDFTFPRDVTVTRNLITSEVTSASPTPATTGVLRLAHTDVIAWRNFANSGDDVLDSDGSDDLRWKGNVIATGAGAVTSITGTSNQIITSSATGAVTLSTPQNINNTATPTFAAVISNSSNPSATGILRLSSTDTIKWRNNFNSGDLALSKDTSDILSWNGNNFVTIVNGTTNQINVSSTGNSVTLSTPQNINSSATPTFASETLTATTNQLVLGTTNTTTINSPAPVSSRTYAIPDTGMSSNFLLSGWGQIVNADISASAGIVYSKLTLAASIVNSDISTGTFGAITGIGNQTQALNMNSHLINNVTDPLSAQDAATKNYVDATLPKQVASTSLTGQNTDLGPTTLFTPTVTGLYQISAYAITTAGTGGGGGNVAPTINFFWTDDFGSQNGSNFTPTLSSTLDLTAGTYNAVPLNGAIEAVSGQPIQYSVSGGTYTDGVYSIYITVVRL